MAPGKRDSEWVNLEHDRLYIFCMRTQIGPYACDMDQVFPTESPGVVCRSHTTAYGRSPSLPILIVVLSQKGPTFFFVQGT